LAALWRKIRQESERVYGLQL